MLSMLSEAQMQCYLILTNNDIVVLQRIYDLLKYRVDGFADGNTYYDFLNYWETTGEKIGISYYNAEIINFLTSDPDFVRFVSVYQSNTFMNQKDAVINCYITALKNKIKSAPGKDRLFYLYHQYNNYHYKHINSNSFDEIIENSIERGTALDACMYYYDTPFYEEASYKEIQLNGYLIKFQETLKLQIERICAEIIFHKLFAGEEFKYSDIMREAQKFMTRDYSRMQYTRVAKKIHKEIYKYLLNNDEILELLDNGITMVDGKVYSIKDALQFALDHFDDLKSLKKEEIEKAPKQAFVREDDETITNEIVQYCEAHKIPYSFDIGTYSKALIKIKLSKNAIQRKYTTYIYSTGGYRDFKQDKKGYYKSLFVSNVKKLDPKYAIKVSNQDSYEDKMMNKLLQVAAMYHK